MTKYLHHLSDTYHLCAGKQTGLSPMPIIVGSPRSGTTLLRFMLDSHPELAIPPETGFLVIGKQLIADRDEFYQALTTYPPEEPGWSDFHIPKEEFRARLENVRPFHAADGFRLFYQMYAARFAKTRWGDKTPNYCRHLLTIQELLPEAHFVHIIRDGRDAAVSLRARFFSPGYDINVQARFWRDNVYAARQQGRGCRHYMEIRYEDLLYASETELRKICDFIELDFHELMLRYYERTPQRLQEHLQRNRADGSIVITQEERLRQQAATLQPPDISRIGTWRHALSKDENFEFERIAGDMLKAFNYTIISGK